MGLVNYSKVAIGCHDVSVNEMVLSFIYFYFFSKDLP